MEDYTVNKKKKKIVIESVKVTDVRDKKGLVGA